MAIYYNTTHVEGDQLAEYVAQAADQEARVFEFFFHNPDTLFTPEHIQRYVMPEAPLTSARRAITNLTSRGLIVKSEKQGIGQFGRPVHYWYRPKTLSVKEL